VGYVFIYYHYYLIADICRRLLLLYIALIAITSKIAGIRIKMSKQRLLMYSWLLSVNLASMHRWIFFIISSYLFFRVYWSTGVRFPLCMLFRELRYIVMKACVLQGVETSSTIFWSCNDLHARTKRQTVSLDTN